MRISSKALSVILTIVICIGILLTLPLTAAAAVNEAASIYTMKKQLSESFAGTFEAFIVESYNIFNPSTGNMDALGSDIAEMVDDYFISIRALDEYVLIFERTGNNYHIKRKSDGKYMKRQGSSISWVDGPSTAYAIDYRDNDRYRIFDSGNGDSLWVNDSDKLMFNGDLHHDLFIFMKSSYRIRYQLSSTSYYDSYALITDDEISSTQRANFIPQSLPLTETGGKIIEYWKDGDNNKYIPGKNYIIQKSIVLTPVYHTHAYLQDTVTSDGNTVGYIKHTCSCGASYLDGFTQQTGVEKLEIIGDSLKVTYTDGTTDDLGSIKGDKGDDGREIEMRTTSTHIQWRYVGDSDWTDLIALSEIIGVKGDTGEQGQQGVKGDKGDKGDPGEDGKDGVNGKNGADGLTPFIGKNGNWWIGDVDTGVSTVGTGASDINNNSDSFGAFAIIALILSVISLITNVILFIAVTKKKRV